MVGGELRVLEQHAMATGSRAATCSGWYRQAGGQQFSFESHLFARIDNGRVDRLIEVARLLEDNHYRDLLTTA